MNASLSNPCGRRRLLSSAGRQALLGFALLAASGAALSAGTASAAPSKPEATRISPAPDGAPPAAEAKDPLAMDSLLDQPRADTDATPADPSAKAPEHPLKTSSTQPTSPTPPAQMTPVPAGQAQPTLKPVAPDVADKADSKRQAAKSPGEDLDPEGVIVPPSASPSNDPLDRPRPAPAAKSDAAKPDPSKPSPAATDGKAEAAKVNPAKADPSKPGAGTPGTPAPQEVVEPLPPLNAAIKAALDKRSAAPIKGAGAAEKRKERDAVAFFYAAHGFAPAWSEKGKAIAAVDPVIARLAKAGEDALNLPNPPTSLKADGTPEDVAASDLALTEAVVAYARQATGARVEPRSISPLIGAKPQLADPAEVLDNLISAGPEAGDKLAALNPSEPRYVALRRKLAELRGDREPAPKSSEAPIPDGPILRVGMQDARVPLLRARFNVEAKSDAEGADLIYDKDVAAAVTAFQREHDLVPSGMLGARTTAVLNGGTTPPRQLSSPKLEATIVANMEMWRWMPREMGRERIEVNVPDYQVTVFHDNEPVAKNRVVVGKTDTPTPIFSNTMKYLIVNPVWNVPQSIIKNEFGGATHGFKARYVHGQLYLQQPAGPGNALGRIKFMFPNDFSVYLHDTPAKHLFSASKRAFSHGCVRVDKPFEFAESVLNDAVPEGGTIEWSQKRLQKMLGTTERYVNLPTALPIHIEYFTASVDADSGRMNLREDVYGYSGAVAESLGYGKSSVPLARLERKTPAARVAEGRPALRKRHVASRRASDDGGYDPRPRVEAAPEQSARSFFFPW